MEDPSITKRLIDFGTDEHEYDEVQDLPEESSNQQQQQQQQQKQKQQHSAKNKPTAAAGASAAAAVDLPPELPPPKQKSVKNSKKSKSKSKIPRSPSLASTLGVNQNNSGNSGNTTQESPTQLAANIPPQTPPLPANYQNKSKHMNGSSTPIVAPLTPIAANATAAAATTPTTSNTNNTSSNINNAIVGSTNINVMGGGVQLNSIVVGGTASTGGNGGSVGGAVVSISSANGAAAHQRGTSMNMPSSHRPKISISPISESPKHFQFLTLTVRKDENGYGMKVSGDNPVFVESVKPGGAAQIAGLVSGDMILKVNGQEVRSEKHPTVVSLIKASTIVELSVKRSQKMTRPTSVGIVPSTPILSGRDRTASITGPQPVDSMKRREMETFKIQTLQKMIEQEKLNLEHLKGDTNNRSYKLSEANIRKLKEQLRQIGAEDAPTIKYQPTVNNKNTALLSPNQIQHLTASSQQQQHHYHQQQQAQQHFQATTPQPQPQSTPAFLSLLPRSLSSLSLGTRKNKIDKDLITSPLNNTTDFLHTSIHATAISPTPPFNMSQSLHQTPTQLQRNSPQQLFYQQHQQQRLKESSKSSNSKNKNKFAAQAKNLIQEDIPPPLPQRNPPRPQLLLDVCNNNSSNNSSCSGNSNNNNPATFSPISDLDHSQQMSHNAAISPLTVLVTNSPQPCKLNTPNANVSQKKRSKAKTKALSDPKMSTQMFLQMETAAGVAGTGGLGGAGLQDGATETDCIPPPLPPRQPGMMEETQSFHKGSFQNLHITPRPSPNSIETLLNYPLVSTCTPVHRDNMAAAFPLSQRPNIVQQLQQHQQQQQQQQQQFVCAQTAVLGQTPHNLNHMNKHRRVVSSPENMHPRHPDRHNKTTSGSWEIVEKDGEITPPGTPPPPYLTAHSAGMSGGSIDEQQRDHASTPTSAGILIESHHFTPLAAVATSGGAVSPTPMIATTHSSRIQAAQISATQKEIMSMEDEDASDQEGPFIDENGPFNYFHRLLEPENAAFLAVFLNYVLSNSEPAPLLFYLITGLYKEGTAKDMRKWAYEIHSTFLVPRAPLSWYLQDESLAREVDNVLQSEFDKVEILRKVFWKSRKRARDIISEQLREFQQKRTAGLGTIYGPTDAQLMEAKGDKQRELHIFEETLMRKLQILLDEYEKDLPIEDPKKLALCSALSTVIHRIFITRSHPNSIVDRVHHFVSREKSFKSRLMGKNRKMIVRGHPLVLRQYYEVTHCNHCQTIIWGVSPQGYHCTDCKLNIHRSCSKVLDENCPGPLPQAKRKDPHNDNKISKFMGKIRPRTSSDFIAMEKRARHEEDFESAEFANERLHSSTSIVRQPSDRRPDAANIPLRSNGNATHNSSDLQSSFHASNVDGSIAGGGNAAAGAGIGSSGISGGTLDATLVQGTTGASGLTAAAAAALANEANAQDAESKDARRERLHQQHQQNKSAPVSVNRSESYKERLSHKRNRNSRRKTSDPSLTSRPNDEQSDLGLSNSNYTASSNSSLSSGGGSESPSTSMEQVGVGVGGGAAAAMMTSQHHHSMHGPHHGGPAHHIHQHSHHDSFHGSIGGSSGSNSTSLWSTSIGGSCGPTIAQLTRQFNFDSDEEDDLIEADWSSNVAAEMLAVLTDAEKKRQEIINEIYQTERSHVRTLKLLERLFYIPLQDSGVLSQDHLQLLFPPALLSLREIHSAFEQKLKQRRIEQNHMVNHVGDLLVTMFDGTSGDELCDFAAQFCARQQIALEALKEKRRKDEQLQKFLSKAEAHKACRRLQLKDLLPTVLQRLTKYPLLFENLYKVTIRVVPENTSEAEAIQRALESSKKILVDVNQAVKTAEDAHKLQNIQRKLDKSTFDKDEFKNLDLTQYRLIHDGSLTMKKNPSIQLHGLLFETMIVLLTKQDDKYSLKYLHAARNTEVNNKSVSPIMSIDSETLVRQEAADKNSFFLIKTKTSQMLELRAPSSSECKTWFKHISDAAEQYKPRSKNANHEPVDDPAIATLPHSSTKESLELTPERPPPLAATATITTTPLAPMMSASSAANSAYNNNNNNDIQLRNGRRESTPASMADNVSAAAYHKQRLSQNELMPSSVNRTMSTRSCGEANNNNYGADGSSNGVTLRHTQSARQANTAAGGAIDDSNTTVGASSGSISKRDSASIVYSNNSNNTRTLMQSSPPLVEPTAIQICISAAHTAEPVLTPAERLRRLDAKIRDGLLEKQKIICDMFRLPVEHFHEIVDIAAMPEAPKDSADIALAAYAQVQSLTEVLNDYMHVTSEQEISAVSTAVCDHCHEKQQQQLQRQRPTTPLTSSSTASSSTTATQIEANADTPPPLPPPNKQTAQAQQQTPAPSVTKLLTPALDEASIHEDDDGYCEIDELRLPAIPLAALAATSATTAAASKAAKTSSSSSSSPPPPLPPPAGSFKQPPPPPPPPAVTTVTAAAAATPELVKRQSTISADSIPEESADEVTQAMDDTPVETTTTAKDTTNIIETTDTSKELINDENPEQSNTEEHETKEAEKQEGKKNDDDIAVTEEEEATQPKGDDTATNTHTTENENETPIKAAAEQQVSVSESKELNDDALSTLSKINNALNLVDNMTQTLPMSLMAMLTSAATTATATTFGTNAAGYNGSGGSLFISPPPPHCGPNRIQHANSLEPSVPCHALNSIVSALNSQISLLLPKINERDMERERLRKENQHLRELLNAMHERQRVESKLETPSDITISTDADIDDIDGSSTTSTTPTPTTLINATPEATTTTTTTQADN